MRQDQAMPGMPGTRYHGLEHEQEQDGTRSRLIGPAIKLVVGLLIAVDMSLLAAPLYYGTASPCHMVGLSRASLHSQAVDEEIALADEIAQDVYMASSYWVRTRQDIASCAGDIGGNTLSALLP